VPELFGARFGGTRLRKHAGRRAEFRVGLLSLQLEIDFVERGKRLPGVDHGTDLYEALGYLPADPETHIGFDPRANGPDKAPLERLSFVVNASYQHWPDRDCTLRCNVVAAAERQGYRRPSEK
jgi:hypothetical protein